MIDRLKNLRHLGSLLDQFPKKLHVRFSSPTRVNSGEHVYVATEPGVTPENTTDPLLTSGGSLQSTETAAVSKQKKKKKKKRNRIEKE